MVRSLIRTKKGPQNETSYAKSYAKPLFKPHETYESYIHEKKFMHTCH